MSFTQLAQLIRANSHEYKLVFDDEDKYPTLVATCKTTSVETRFKYCSQQCNIILARSTGASYPSLSFKTLSSDDVHVVGINNPANKQTIATQNNNMYNDLLVIRDYFREHPPSTPTAIQEYCRLFKKGKEQYDHIISIDLPYFNQAFTSFGKPYLYDAAGKAVTGDAEALNEMYTRGSHVLAQVRLRFEMFDDKLAMTLYVIAARLNKPSTLKSHTLTVPKFRDE